MTTRTEIAPRVDPQWRSTDVVALCSAMREQRDFSATPILADALQDAGCDNESMLAVLRNPDSPQMELEIAVAAAYSEESRQAVIWLDNAIANLREEQFSQEEGDQQHEQLTYANVVQCAINTAISEHKGEWQEDWITQYGGQNWSAWGSDNKEELHQQVAIAHGTPLGTKNIFSCSC
jgi:hypothetical protein